MINLSRLTYFLLSILFVLFISTNSVKAQDWELLWSYDVSALSGYDHFGSETDGTYFYTTFLNGNGFGKFDFEGNWIETFSIPGAMYIRDLAFDGDYFYGSNDNLNEGIYILDFEAQTLIGTIPVTLNIGINHIAYDSDNDGFWVGDWSSNLFLVGRDGSTINTIQQTTFNVGSVAGSAYDNVSEGGPYLWLQSQSFATSPCAIVQINIETGLQTGIWHDAMSDAGLGMDYGFAGGLFNSTDMLPGTFVIGGLIQGEPYKVYAYSMLPFGNPPPILTTPENGSYGIDDTPLFQWEAVDYAVSYQIQVSSLSNFSILDIDVEAIETTQYQAINSLTPLSKYYWRVRALDNEGIYGAWSRKFSFFTDGDLPQPVLLSPGDGAENLMPNTEFSWEGNIAALNYYLQISSTPDFSSLVVDLPTLTRTRYILDYFEMNTQYWWRVAMTNPANTGDWSEAWTFTTGSYFQVGTETETNYQWGYPTGYGNASGGAKQQFLIRPEEIIEAGGSPGFLMSLGFNVAVINSGVPLESYEIKLKSVNNTELGNDWDMEGFTSVYYNDAYVPTEGWNMHEFSSPYFWDGVSSLLVDVCFNNMESSSNESCYITNCSYIASRYYQNDNNETICTGYPEWTNLTSSRPNMQFQLEIPQVFPPFLESPLHKSVCANTTPLFEWSDCEGAISYTIQVAQDIDFNFPVFETVTTTSSYQLTEANDLDEVTQYFWRVNATDGENISYWSRTFGFVTEG
ncbi:MAG TPA: fibronectin type III domain-containing protein, partial [Candidatus Kapabacteria bacterium]|nr:fibronectin type III domain-containing protein [Candidatus Kapabacteria bacterium]